MYEQDEATIKWLLSTDFKYRGIAETIESVTKNHHEMEAVQDAIGRAIFLDGGMLEEGGSIFSKNRIESIALDSDRVMQMLCYYAANTESFMSRLKG